MSAQRTRRGNARKPGGYLRIHYWGRGEACPHSKLTKDAVVEIRAARGVEPQKALAARFGVAPSLISAVQNRKAWAWVP